MVCHRGSTPWEKEKVGSPRPAVRHSQHISHVSEKTYFTNTLRLTDAPRRMYMP